MRRAASFLRFLLLIRVRLLPVVVCSSQLVSVSFRLLGLLINRPYDATWRGRIEDNFNEGASHITFVCLSPGFKRGEKWQCESGYKPIKHMRLYLHRLWVLLGATNLNMYLNHYYPLVRSCISNSYALTTQLVYYLYDHTIFLFHSVSTIESYVI